MGHREFLLAVGMFATAASPGVDSGQSAGEWAGVKVSDPSAARALRRALDDASLRLIVPECASLLADFRDLDGHPLRVRLDAFSVDAREYLHWIQFHDGSDPPCGNGRTLLYTSPGSRVVRACSLAVERAGWTGADHLSTTVIHEMLHTLGLGENPPTSEEITANVRRKCRS